MQGKISPKSIAVTQYSIPAHIRDENPELVKFFEYYFAWMSQNGNPMDLLTNMEDYRDVDETTPQFIDLITKQFISFIPASSTVNRAMVANHIKDFYKAKGTLPSYDFLLNILTGQHAELTWNSEKVFRPSSNSSTRDSTMFVYSTALWNTLCQGSIIEQYYPTEATALVETVAPLIFNNKLINELDIDPESIHGNFVPNGLVRVLNNTVNRSFIYADIYYTEVSTTILNNVVHSLTVQTYTEPSRTYPGLIVKQVGSNFRAVIVSLNSRVVVNNQIQITWTLKSVTGTLGTGDIYLVASAAEATTYNKGDYQYGSIAPTISGVIITNGGALNETGKDIGYIGGTGSPFVAKINEVGGGSIDTVDITANGYGYSVGDSVTVDNSSGGTGFAAVVDAIDGQNASLALTFELDNVQIANGGDSFAVGDIIYLSDGSYPIESLPTIFTVSSINSTLALNKIVVNSGGYGYHYTKLALLDTTANALVAGFAATATVQNGVITAINITSYPSLSHSTLKVLANGDGATASATTSGGAVNSISVLNGGFNYVNPVVTINTSSIPTRLASITATKDANGTITGFTIVDGGAGYGASVTVTITEMVGAGFSATAIANNTNTGPITGLTITNRGTYTKLPTCFGAPYILKSVGSLYNALTIPTGTTLTIPNGTFVQIGGRLGNGLVMNLKYRIKSAAINNPGDHYTYVGIDTTDGIGTGAVINPVIQNGIVTGFTFSNHGTGYTSAQVAILSPGGGKGFQGVCNLSAGQIASITIINGGVGYSNTDTVVFTGNGANAAATIGVTNGVVTSMVVADGGKNYAYDTALTYIMEPVANPTAVAGSFTPVIQNGAIASVVVNSGGSGYVAGLTNDLKNEDGTKLLTQTGDFLDFDTPYDEPMLAAGTPARIGLSMAQQGSLLSVGLISGGRNYIDQTELAPLEIYVVSATGVGAVILPILENGKLVATQILHGGTNYKTGDMAIVQGGGGTGAVITPIVYGGKVIDFTIINHGQNYRYGTSILVIGDGAGADIYPIVNTSISEVRIINGGSNYQNPSITITDASGSGAIALPIVNNGSIVGVYLISGGTHYVNPSMTVVDTTGTGAVLVPFVKRNIETVNVNTGGSRYVGGETYISGDGDDASMSLFFENAGSITAPNLYIQGTGYTKTPQFSIIDTSNKGRVTSIKILNGGAQYLTPPNISLAPKFSGLNQIAGGASLICYGNNVGAVNSVSLTSFGADWTEPPVFQFPLSAVLLQNANFAIGETVTVDRYPYKQSGDVLFDLFTEAGEFIRCEFKLGFFKNEDGSYLLNEDSIANVPDFIDIEDVGDIEMEFYEIDTGGGVLAPYYDAGPSAVVFDVDFSRNILELKQATTPYILVTEDGAEMRSEQDITLVDQHSNGIYIGDTLIGSTSKAEATIKWFNRAAGVHQTSGIGLTPKQMANSVGVLDHSQSKIHDGKRIQDFSYSLQSKAPLFNYESVVKSTVHPAGYQMYGTMLSGSVATGTRAVTVPFTFGIKGASASFQTKLNEKSGFVNTSLSRYTNLMFYIRTLGSWYTTYGGFLGNYTFEQFDPNSSSFLTSIPPLVALEPWVAPTWSMSGATVNAGSDIIGGITTPAGVNFNFRVIAWDANGNSIFRENRLKLEDGTYLLNEVGGAYIDTDEDMVHVASYGTNQIQASKNSKVTTATSPLTIATGTVLTISTGALIQIGSGITAVIEDVPSLLTNLTTYNTVATPLTINSGQVITIIDNTILKIV